MIKVDVVICTKDRYHLLPSMVDQVKRKIPFHNIIVIDSSERPDYGYNGSLWHMLDVITVFTPNARLGYARQAGLFESDTEYLVYLDDDVELGDNWFNALYEKLLEDERNVAVSSLIRFKCPSHPEIEYIFDYSRSSGASSGAMLMNRHKIASIGGWDMLIHRGEDTELYSRVNRHGLRWLRLLNVQVIHPVTWEGWLHRAYVNGYGTPKRFKMRTRIFKSLFAYARIILGSSYYTFKAKNLSVFKAYFLYRLMFFLGSVKGVIER